MTKRFFINELFKAIPEGCTHELVKSLPSPKEMEKFTIVKILEIKNQIENLPKDEDESFSRRMGSRF